MAKKKTFLKRINDKYNSNPYYGYLVLLSWFVIGGVLASVDFDDYELFLDYYSFDDLEYKNGLYYNERGNLATGKIKGIVPRSEEVYVRGFGNQIFRVQDEVAGQTYMEGTLKDGEKVDTWSYNLIRTEYSYYGYNTIATFDLEGGNVGLGWAKFNSDNERTSYGRCGEKSEFGIVTNCNSWFSYGEIDAYKRDIMSRFQKN
tara:strand:+ start:79 stop:684 length:606 start_codon:yes stop_codon:yes gene_type:complete